MKIRKFLIIVIFALATFGQTLYGQQSASDQKEFADTQEKAGKGDAQAQLILGYYYAVGFGVVKNQVESVIWYRKAAEQNLSGAQYNLGTCYELGQRVTKDMAEAVKWYRKAAEQNMPEAQFNLGGCYKRGEGVATNFIMAVDWYRKSAEQNLASAQFNLGLCCVRGQGTKQDDVEGYKWIFLSSAQGFEQAKDTIKKLDAGLDPKEIAEGKNRANIWLEQHKKP